MRLVVAIAVLCLLAACGSRYPGSSYGYHRSSYPSRPTRYYPPPGPPGDPWGPYIREASTRFGVPDQWIREVMRQESGGQEQVVSSAGAMGLMQLMPGTYDDMRQRYGLGGDPFEPHDNIMAGTAYIRLMYDRFGAPAFLAAYNAGPNRVDNYLGGGGDLPDETVNYVASIAPRLGNSLPMSGPLSVYAQQGPVSAPVVVASAPAPALTSGACDPDAAYDPDRPCAPIATAAAVPSVAVASAPLPAIAPAVAPAPAQAFTPPARAVVPAAAPAPAIPPSPPPAPAGADWAIQVGAFAASDRARYVAASTRDTLPDLLGGARIELLPTTPFGGAVIYRARLANLSASAASTACARLTAQLLPCMVIPPGQAL